MALHLEELEAPGELGLADWPRLVLLEKPLQAGLGAIEDDIYIIVTRRPGLLHQLLRLPLVESGHRVAELVQGLSKGHAPALMPAPPRVHEATAVAPPPLDAMGTAPGGILHNLHLVAGRMCLQEAAIVR